MALSLPRGPPGSIVEGGGRSAAGVCDAYLESNLPSVSCGSYTWTDEGEP